VERRLAEGGSVVLEIEVQGARQVRAAMPEAVLIFVAPPDPGALRDRLEGRGTDSPEAIQRRLRTADLELEAQAEFPHVVVNDDLQNSASELEKRVRDELSLHS
jgi:guanylate kinase